MKFVFFTLIFLISTAQAETVFGRVDLQRVLLSVNEGKKIRTQLKKEFDRRQKLAKSEETKFNTERQKFEKSKGVLSAKARSTKEQNLQKMFVGLQKKIADYEREMRDIENKKKAPILKKIKTIVEIVSKLAKVDMTFESSTTPILYVKSEKDLTNQVIKAYNKKYKVK